MSLLKIVGTESELRFDCDKAVSKTLNAHSFHQEFILPYTLIDAALTESRAIEGCSRSSFRVFDDFIKGRISQYSEVEKI